MVLPRAREMEDDEDDDRDKDTKTTKTTKLVFQRRRRRHQDNEDDDDHETSNADEDEDDDGGDDNAEEETEATVLPSALSACSGDTRAFCGISPTLAACSTNTVFCWRGRSPRSSALSSSASDATPGTSRPALRTELSQVASLSASTPLGSDSLPPSFKPVRPSIRRMSCSLSFL